MVSVMAQHIKWNSIVAWVLLNMRQSAQRGETEVNIESIRRRKKKSENTRRDELHRVTKIDPRYRPKED